MTALRSVLLMLGVSLLGSGMTALYMRNAGDKTRRGETSNASQDSPPPAAQLLERTIIVQQPTPADSKSNSSEERSIAGLSQLRLRLTLNAQSVSAKPLKVTRWGIRILKEMRTDSEVR